MVMKVGLLWYDGDPKRPWLQKVDEAAQRYYDKFGVHPDTCYLNPATIPAEQPTHKKMKIVLENAILPNHFWLGIADS